MTLASEHERNTRRRLGRRRRRGLRRAPEAAGDVARRVHGARWHGRVRRNAQPVLAAISLLAIAAGAGASGALNMWYDADIDGLMRRTRMRPIPAGRLNRSDALAFGIVLGAFSVGILGPCRQLARRRAARLHDLLLCRDLHGVAEARDRAEHRYRRRGGRAPAGHRLGGDDGAGVARAARLLPDRVHVDAAAFLGARALHARRLRACRHSDDAQRRRRRIRPAGRSLSTQCSWRRSGCFPSVLGYAGPAYGLAAFLLGAEFVRRAALLWRRGDADGNRAAKSLFGYSIVYLFGIFGVRLVEAASSGWIGG